jgi:hypothetical protein
MLPFAGAYSGSDVWLLCVRDQPGEPASVHVVSYSPQTNREEASAAEWPSLDAVFAEELHLYRQGRVGAVRFGDGRVTLMGREQFGALLPGDEATWLSPKRERGAREDHRDAPERAPEPDALDLAERFLATLAERGWIVPRDHAVLEAGLPKLGKLLRRRIARSEKARAIAAWMRDSSAAFETRCNERHIEDVLRAW